MTLILEFNLGSVIMNQFTKYQWSKVKMSNSLKFKMHWSDTGKHTHIQTLAGLPYVDHWSVRRRMDRAGGVKNYRRQHVMLSFHAPPSSIQLVGACDKAVNEETATGTGCSRSRSTVSSGDNERPMFVDNDELNTSASWLWRTRSRTVVGRTDSTDSPDSYRYHWTYLFLFFVFSFSLFLFFGLMR